MLKKWLAVLLTMALILTTALASLSIQVAAVTYGDVNGDDSVDMKDVLLLRKFIAGMGGEIDEVAADVNGDDSIDMKDVLMMRKYIANLIPELPGKGDAVSDEPSGDEPVSEPSEDSGDEPSIDEPVSEGPSDEPISEDPVSEGPSDEPISEDPSEEPVSEEPVSEDPSEEPVSEEPISEESSDETSEDVSEEEGDTLMAQWVTRNGVEEAYWSSSKVQGTIYVRNSCGGVVDGTTSMNWGTFSSAYSTLAANQYMIITFEGAFPGYDSATHAVTMRAYRAPSAPDDKASHVVLTAPIEASESSLTYRMNGPVVYNNTSHTPTIYAAWTGLTTMSQVTTDFTVTVSVYQTDGEISDPEYSVEPSEDTSGDASETSSEVSVDPVTGLAETVLYDQTVSISRTAGATKVGSWFRSVPAIRNDVLANGAINPDDGEYYLVTVTGYVSSGTAYLYLGENVSWEEYHGVGSPLTTTEQTVTLKVSRAIYGVEGDIYVCDGGDLGHTINVSYLKVSVFRKPGGGAEEIDFDPTASYRTPDQIVLTLYDADANEYGVTWHTYEDAGTHVLQYVKLTPGEAPDFTAATTVPATTEAYETQTMPYDLEHNTFVYGNNVTAISDYAHKAVMTGLDYDTQYAYRVGDTDADIWSEVGTFQTPGEGQAGCEFVYLSDTQVGEAANTEPYAFMHKALEGATRLADPEFIVNGGDIVQSSKYLHLWRSQLNGNADFLMNLPMMPVTGNHDSIYDVAGDHEIVKHFNIDYPAENNVPEYGMFYSYNYGGVHFIVVNTDCFAKSGGALDDTQLAWLRADLENNDQLWTIVMMHRPMFAIRQTEVQANREQLLGMFNEYGVDLVIQAHEHVYMRSYPIDGTGTVDTNPTTRTQWDKEYFINPNGVIFLTCATAGADGKAPMDETDKSFCHTYGRGYASSWAKISVYQNRLEVSVNYETASGTQAYENGTWGIIKE